MSQQGFTIVSIQIADKIEVIQEMGDTEFLSKKEFDGKLFDEISPSFSTVGVKITHIVPSGKTFYLANAALLHTSTGNLILDIFNTTVQNRNCFVTLSYDGVIIDRLYYNFKSQGALVSDPGGMAPSNQKLTSSLIGKSLDGDGIKTVEIEVTAISGDYAVELEGFEENTGDDPTILASQITVDANVAGDTGDLAFLKSQILAGNDFQVSGDINILNDTIEFIPAVGKTAFLVEAKITSNANPTPADFSEFGSAVTVQDQVVAALKIDTVEKDKAKIGSVSRGEAGNNAGAGRGGNSMSYSGEGHFNVKLLSLIGDGIKKIEIENILDSGSAFASMAGYVSDT